MFKCRIQSRLMVQAKTFYQATFNKNQNVSYKDLEDKVKSVLESNRGITDVDLRLSKQAKFTVNFKNGTKKVIDLKAGIYSEFNKFK